MKYISLLFILALLFSGCDNTDCQAPIPKDFVAFYYNAEKDSNFLEKRGIYDLLTIYYINDQDQKVNIDYRVMFGFQFDQEDNYLFSREFTTVAGSGVEEFYFEMDDKTDTLTLLVDSSPHPECEGLVYNYKNVLFNGEPADTRMNSIDEMTYELISNKQ